MSLNYQTVLEKDFSSGINKLAAEDAVPQGYVEDLENMQANAQGYVEKRKGYQAYAGTIPLRVSKTVADTLNNYLYLYFDELSGGTAQIDFSTLKSSPVVLFGTGTHLASGTTSRYYPSFVVDPRVKLGTTITLVAADIGATTKDLFVGLGYNTTEGTKNIEVVYADAVTVNSSTFDVTIGSIEGAPEDINCFVYVKNHSTLAGESWADTVAPVTVVVPGTGVTQHTYTITQAMHQLNTQNYICRFYRPDSGEEIFPDSLNVAGSTITVQVTDNDPTWNGQLRVVIASTPEIDVETRAVVAGQSATITFPIGADFAFFEIYQENSPNNYSRVMPDNITIASQTASVAVTNLSPSQVKFRILWERATVRTNKLRLTEPSVLAGAEDLNPQLCLYGLDHTELYPDAKYRAGWVTHIDSYKSEGENYLVAGLGWNLFKAVYHTSLPSRQPLLRVSVATAGKVGPLFDGAGRDRTSYYFTGGGEGWADIVSINYQESTGWTRVVVSTPNRVTNAGVGNGVDLQHDRLTIEGSSQKIHRGEWAIMAFSLQANTLTFDVMNPSIISSDYDEDSVGEAGVFTDKVVFTSSVSTYSPVVGDRLEGSAFPQGLSGSLTCISTIDATSWFTGVGELIDFPEGQVYIVRRTGYMLRLRDVNNPAVNPYENFVVGDVLALSDRERRYRIQYAIPDSVTGLAAVFDAAVGEATVTKAGSTTWSAPFKVGQRVTLISAGRFSGEFQIKELPDTATMVLDCSSVKDSTTPGVPQACSAQGRILELNYSDEFYDDPNSLLTVTVPLRWFPLENPTGSPSRTKHLESSPYTRQPFVRSVMAQDNMYFANYNDHLLKYDGVSLYRSGLVRWQPAVFAAVDTTSSAKIIVPAQKVVIGFKYQTADTYFLEGTKDNFTAFFVGSKIEIPNSALNPFTIQAIVSVGGNNEYHLFLDKKPDITAGGTIFSVTEYQPNIYRYYFRLTAYDANDNVVTSATTGSNEFYVSLTQSAAIKLRLLGLPKFEQLNYSRIYLEVYRTKRNSVAPFYNVYKNLIPFDTTKPYIDITDTISDEALPAQPDDEVLTFLAGERLGNGLSQPPQAKYCTVSDNRLVLANIQDDPKIQVDIFGNPLLTAFANTVFHLRKDGVQPAAPLQPINDLTFELRNSTNAVTINTIDPEVNSVALTLASVPAGLAIGHWVYLFDDTLPTNLTYAGWYKVSIIDGSVVTVTVTGQGNVAPFAPSTTYVNKLLACTSDVGSPTSFPVFTGTDYNYGWRNANNENLYSASARVLLRLANAINFSQTVSSSPWVFANAGLDLGGQTLTLTFPENSLTTKPELVFPAVLGGVEYYGNKVKVKDVVGGENVGVTTAKFPSRVVISYPNYAEVFHRPFDDNATLSQSIVDVNPADGQEITGVFPFFSESAFGASLKSASVIVFKTNSIYIVNPDSRQSQQLETNGLGCTAPYSIAATREGIMFANEAGLYRLTRSLTVEPIGSYIDRLWREGVNHTELGLMQGHAYGVGRKYKVSIPKVNETTPSEALVYDYTREDSKNTYGSWTRYTNHPATGWCNLLEDAFFASTRGRVYKVSNANSKYDYQDDGQAITGYTIFRALDFGDSAVRKRVLHLLVHYRIPNLLEGPVDVNTAKVSMGINLVDNYQQLDTFKLDVPNASDGLSTLSPNKQVTLRYAVRNPKSLYFQTKIEDNGLHTPLQVTGLSFRVTGLGTEGITEAAQTMKE